jgi:Saccharopine dehydrogenase NADP binding domain
MHDLLISLIPYNFHATVIKSAIRNKKNVVTISYISPAMMELDEQCKDAGITILNEVGLDPGVSNSAHPNIACLGLYRVLKHCLCSKTAGFVGCLHLRYCLGT